MGGITHQTGQVRLTGSKTLQYFYPVRDSSQGKKYEQRANGNKYQRMRKLAMELQKQQRVGRGLKQHIQVWRHTPQGTVPGDGRQRCSS